MGNGKAKELMCTTHGHELRWRNVGGRVCAGQRGIKERKKWDNCNSIIKKIYFKNYISMIFALLLILKTILILMAEYFDTSLNFVPILHWRQRREEKESTGLEPKILM